MTAQMSFAAEAGWKMRIAELVLEGNVEAARFTAESFAACRDAFPTDSEWKAALGI